MALYQLIVPIIALFFITKAVSLHLNGKKTLRELLGWLLIWGGVALIAILPDSLAGISNALGIKSHINAIIFLTLGVLLYGLFSLAVTVEDLEHHVTTLARKEALRDLNKKR